MARQVEVVKEQQLGSEGRDEIEASWSVSVGGSVLLVFKAGGRWGYSILMESGVRFTFPNCISGAAELPQVRAGAVRHFSKFFRDAPNELVPYMSETDRRETTMLSAWKEALEERLASGMTDASARRRAWAAVNAP